MSEYTEEHFDEDHRDAHREHMDFAAKEAAELNRNCWNQWIEDLEAILGHSMDGDQVVDGYSLDYAHEAFNAGLPPFEYSQKVTDTKARRASGIRPIQEG